MGTNNDKQPPQYRFKTADWDYGGLPIDEVARRIAEDDPEFEAHREHIEALAIRVMELLAERIVVMGSGELKFHPEGWVKLPTTSAEVEP